MKAEIEMEVASQPYGKTVEQKVELFKDKGATSEGTTKTWNQNDIETAEEEKQNLTFTFRGLSHSITYTPKVTKKRMIKLESTTDDDTESQFEDKAEDTKACYGSKFTTNYWSCGNSTDQKILSTQLCDGFDDCNNRADEKPSLCKGLKSSYVLIGVGCYVFLGIVAYLGERESVQ